MTDEDLEKRLAEILDDLRHRLVRPAPVATQKPKRETDARITKAVKILMEQGFGDGAHHKQYAIVQALEALLGKRVLNEMRKQHENEGYEWDEGIPG